jgi:hypothetical protein
MICTVQNDPVIARANFVGKDGTHLATRELRLRELTFTLVESSPFEIKKEESLKTSELAREAEDLACEGLPTLKEALASLPIGETDLESLIFFDFPQVFSGAAVQLTAALTDSDPLFLKAYGGLLGARIMLQEHAQGIRSRSEADVMALCRIAFRTNAYMRCAIRAATEETATIRARLEAGEHPTKQASPAALALLTVPTREVIAGTHNILSNKKQSANSKGRRADAWVFARAEFERIVQSGGDTKQEVIAAEIAERMIQAQIAKPLAASTIKGRISKKGGVLTWLDEIN